MSTKNYPKQTSFTIKSEDWGKTMLSDGSAIEARVILCDLVINGEDVLGPDIVIAHVVGMRIIPTPELVKKTEGKPLPQPSQAPPSLTRDAGFEKIDITKVDKVTESIYRFDNYILTLKLEIQSVARNLNFRVPSGAPLYTTRWSIATSVAKAQ